MLVKMIAVVAAAMCMLCYVLHMCMHTVLNTVHIALY